MALSEAIIATYKTIHIARSLVHTVRQLRSPCRSCRRGAQIPKVLAFRQRKRAPRYPQTAASRLPLSRDAREQLLLDPFVGPSVMRCPSIGRAKECRRRWVLIPPINPSTIRVSVVPC
jgi:hypothetical protein